MQSAASKKVTLFHAGHQDALVLDYGVLEKLLRSNRAAQSRTKYFQRLDMGCRCIRKKNLLQLYADYQQLSRTIEETVDRKRKQKKRQEVFWDISPKTAKSREKNKEEMQKLIDKLLQIRRQLEQGIPEAIGRLEYASQAVFQEMARGYFLPIGSVAVAAVARMRVLLQNLGSQILYDWSGWEKGLEDAFGTPTVQSSLAWDANSRKELQQSFHPPKEGSWTEQKQKDQTHELLAQVGVVLDCKEDAPENISTGSESGKPRSGSDKQRARSAQHASTDLGEQLVGQPASGKEEYVADYMDTAISEIQKKAREKSLAKKTKAAQSTSERTTSDDANEKDLDSGQKPSRSKKKKKRKDSSKPKSSKKAKAGEFFDDLFR